MYVGAVKVGDDGKNTRMLHFRTLDWGMDPLRKVIVHLDFVERPGGDVIVSIFGPHALWTKISRLTSAAAVGGKGRGGLRLKPVQDPYLRLD